LAVAAALTELSAEAVVLLVSGADDVTRLGLPPQVEIIKLPGLRKVDNSRYASRRLRVPVAQIRALRSALLLAAAKAFRPAVVLVDKHPFGPDGEFRSALEAVRSAGGRAVLGLRDILDDSEAVLQEWSPHKLQMRIAEHYDLVLVYGDRSIFDPVREYAFPPELAERTRFCGYVVNRENPQRGWDLPGPAPVPPDHDRPVVLATVGGGEDGFFLLQTFIRAACRADWKGRVVAGSMTPDHELQILQKMAAEAGVTLHTFVPDLSALFWSVDAVVCMGGYNTLAEAVSRGVPVVCVPRVAPRAEQQLRATAFARLGLLRALRPEALSVETLRREVSVALHESRHDLLDRAQAALSFDGARQAAGQLLALATSQARPIPATEEALLP
jgi:predicted glycosyltransferase